LLGSVDFARRFERGGQQGRDAVAVALENGKPECAALIERHALGCF